MLRFMVMLFKFYIYLATPTNEIWRHASDNIRNFLFPTAKTNTPNVLPMCQDKFSQVVWKHLLLPCFKRVFNKIIKSEHLFFY